MSSLIHYNAKIININFLQFLLYIIVLMIELLHWQNMPSQIN